MHKSNTLTIFAIQNKNTMNMKTIRTFADLRAARIAAADDEVWDFAVAHIVDLPYVIEDTSTYAAHRLFESYLDGLRDAIHGAFSVPTMTSYGNMAYAYLDGWRAFGGGKRKATVITR